MVRPSSRTRSRVGREHAEDDAHRRGLALRRSHPTKPVRRPRPHGAHHREGQPCCRNSWTPSRSQACFHATNAGRPSHPRATGLRFSAQRGGSRARGRRRRPGCGRSSSLSSTFGTWLFTVASPTTSSTAISALDETAREQQNTSCSRSVEVAGDGPLGRRCRGRSEPLDHATRHVRREQRIPAGDDPHGLDERSPGCCSSAEAARAGRSASNR